MALHGVYGMPDGTFKDAWGNVVEDPDFSEGDADGDGQSDANPKSYTEMTSQELKDEAKSRQDAGRELDLTGVKTKSDLIAVLEADDAAQAAQTPGA